MEGISSISVRTDVIERKNLSKKTLHQNEHGRKVEVQLYQNGVWLDLRTITGVSVKVRAGNKAVQVETDGTVGVTGLAEFIITEEMTAASGDLDCRIDIIVGNDLAASATFTFYVVPDPTAQGAGGNTPVTTLIGNYYIGATGDTSGAVTVSATGAGQ